MRARHIVTAAPCVQEEEDVDAEAHAPPEAPEGVVEVGVGIEFDAALAPAFVVAALVPGCAARESQAKEKNVADSAASVVRPCSGRRVLDVGGRVRLSWRVSACLCLRAT